MHMVNAFDRKHAQFLRWVITLLDKYTLAHYRYGKRNESLRPSLEPGTLGLRFWYLVQRVLLARFTANLETVSLSGLSGIKF